MQIMGRWWNDEGAALLIQESFLESYLSQSDRVLISFGYQQKSVSGNFDGSILQRENTIVVRAEGRVRTIKHEVEKPKVSKIKVPKAAAFSASAKTPRKSIRKRAAKKATKS